MKRSVIVFIDWFYPAYKAGGPIKSVFNIINAVSDQFEFVVVTSNKDLDGTVLEVEVNCEIIRDKYSIYYLDGKADRKKIYKELIEKKSPEIIYYNGVFSYSFTINPLFYFKSKTNIKQIVAPRGMLRKGALSIKPLKKRLFLSFSKFFLFKGITWHASTEEETLEVKRVFGSDARTFVAQNISSSIKKRNLQEKFKRSNELKLVFIARVLPIKNLLFLLQLIKSMKELPFLKLDIYGPIEDKEYWKQCLAYINNDNRISYQGILSPDDVNTTLKNYHFFVLPSLNENYGHSIVEAINAGVPVFISNETPWKNLEQERVGFNINLTKTEVWLDKIKLAYAMEHKTYQMWSESCYSFAQNTFVNKSIINRNIDLFLSN